MHRFWEIILGLDKGFLSRQGDWSWRFNPDWPFQRSLESMGGASLYNLVLAVLGVSLVVYVYRREAKSPTARVFLATLRLVLLAVLLVLLNRPVLILGQERKEPSVVAILVDDTISMSVPDMPGPGGTQVSRILAAQDLLGGADAELLRSLGKIHDLRLYRFGKDAQPVASVSGQQQAPPAAPVNPSATRLADPFVEAARKVDEIKPAEDGTLVAQSLYTVLDELQGQRLAGIVVLTDGHDTPVRERPEVVNDIRTKFGVPVYTVAIGQDRMPRNIEVLKPEYEPSAFVDDYTVVKASVRATGFEANHHVHLTLKRKKDGRPALDDKGQPIEKDIELPDDRPVTIEMPFMPAQVLGLDPRHLPRELPPEDKSLDLIVEAAKEPGEINEQDNVRDVSIEVLDTQIKLLFVDGYPRWEYRYIKNSMVRDKTMHVNCLLTSADPNFVQEASEGVTPIKAFPVSIEQLLQYDVVLFGDVDQHQFTDAQLQLLSDFVSKRGGGFGMVAGPRYSPNSYKNTPIQPVLPVDIARSEADESKTPITQGFRPKLTGEGLDTSIFRFYPKKEENRRYVETVSPPLFWYCHNVTARPQATVLAEHPVDSVPGLARKAPLLVISQFGAGRTLFSAVDDSWRWRFYTGENIFSTYWVQQVRYLARNKKLDERKVKFDVDQPEYQIGQQVALDLNVLSPQLSHELSPQIPVEILDASGQPVRRVTLNRQENADRFTVSWTADTVGRFTARLPALGDAKAMERPFVVKVPQLELDQPQVDRSLLSSLGQPVEFDKAREQLPQLIRSAAKTIPLEVQRPLWDAPLALIVFVLVITAEWVLRKVYGML